MKNCCVVLRYGSNAIFLGSVEASDVNVSSNITSYPIYSGDTVGEHMIREPITVSLRGSYAVNGSDGILINNDVPSLKRFQQEMEALRDNGTLCDYYKIAYNPSDPRFVKRTGMALKNISWVEHFNSLEFSLSFQQVFVASVASGPSIYAGQSNYSNGSEQMPGSYNPNTGVVTDLPTGQTANTSRAPGEVSYDDFGIVEKDDEYIPDFSEPYSSNFIETYMNKEDVMASIIALCCDEGIVEEAFLQYMQNPTASMMANIGIGVGVAGALISGAKLIGAVGKVVTAIGAAKASMGAAVGATTKVLVGVSSAFSVAAPVTAAVLAAIAAAAFIALIVVCIKKKNEEKENANKFKKAVFEASKRIGPAGAQENDETAKRFVSFCESIYQSMLVYDDKFLTYEIPTNQGAQQARVQINDASIDLEISKGFAGLLNVRIKTSDGRQYLINDLASTAKLDFGDCINGNCDFKVSSGTTTYYGYFLWKNGALNEIDKKAMTMIGTGPFTDDEFGTIIDGNRKGSDPRNFVIAISSIPPSDFADLLAENVSNHIYTNYQDVIGEG